MMSTMIILALNLKVKAAVVIKVLFFPDTIVRVHDDTRTTSYSSTCITCFNSLESTVCITTVCAMVTDPDRLVTGLTSMCYDYRRLI